MQAGKIWENTCEESDLEGHQADARRKHQAPEIQTMYTLNIPVSTIRNKMRQEFERHRYVSKLRTADVLIYNSHSEFQVRMAKETRNTPKPDSKTLTHYAYHRRRSTSGSSSHTCSSTSAQKRTRRRDYRRRSLPVSLRYLSIHSTLSDERAQDSGLKICSVRHANKLPFLQGRN